MSKLIDKTDAMLVDIQYVRANRRTKEPDALYMIWKEISTGEKHLKVVMEPKMEIHFEKPELRNHNYVKNYTLLKDTDTKVVKYTDIPFAIANDLGDQGKVILNNFFSTKNPQYLKSLYCTPYVFGADYDVRVWYRNQWFKTYHNDKPKTITKGFMDIEVDIMEQDNNQSDCPIDLVTLIDTSTNQSYTFSLIGVECKDRDTSHMTEYQKSEEMRRRQYYEDRQKQQEKILTMEHPDEYMRQKAHELFDESYPDMEYNFYFYNDERKMLVHIFQLIHKLRLDFIGFWNIAFDIPKIIERLTYLGLDPKEVMCDKDFPIKQCYFKDDHYNFDVKNKGHFFFCSSYTVYWDQMVVYAALRKGGSELRSNKLTYIAKLELQDEKLDYSEIGSIKTLSYVNWEKYILYNIKDVLLQTGIEHRTSDCESYYNRSIKNLTPYEDVFKQTKMLRDVQLKSFESQGLVPGPNMNIIRGYSQTDDNIEFDSDGNVINSDEGNTDKFEGALVGEPQLISNFGSNLFGKPSNCLFLFSIDMDMSAFYPSTIRAMNIDPSCLIFKCILDARQYDVRGGNIKFNGITDVHVANAFLKKKLSDSFDGDVAKECMDNFQTKNWISTGHKWLNLPSASDIFEELAGLGA